MSSDAAMGDEALLKIHAAVRRQLKSKRFQLSPCLDAIKVLEDVAEAASAGRRIELALDTVKSLGGMENPTLGIRALRAAAAHEGCIADPLLRRKWLLFLGAMEIGAGRAGSAMEHLVASLELARDLGDEVGIINAWNNITLLAAKAGQYEDAIRFASQAIDLIEEGERRGDADGADIAGPLLNRGNALRRLGRIDEATNDLASAVSISLCQRRSVLVSIRQAKGLAMLAGCHFERGEISRGNAYLSALKEMVKAGHCPPHIRLFADLAMAERAGALALWSKSLEALEELLRRCRSDHFDLREDVLYALQRIAIAAGRDDKADEYVSLLSDGMRANAEAVISNFSRFCEVDKDMESALREVDNVVHGISRYRSTAWSAESTWTNLVGMASSASMLEDGSGEHGVRVAALCSEVGAAMLLSGDSMRLLEQASLLHDIGKAASPASLLSKVDPLTDHESALLSRHSDDGGRLIEHSPLANRGRIADVVRLHHHPFDGVGAPRPIRSEAIPVEARILAACDSFDALINGRPRRSALSVSEALKEILRVAGREIDPKVAAVLIESVRRICRSHGNIIAFLSEGAVRHGYTSARRRLLRM